MAKNLTAYAAGDLVEYRMVGWSQVLLDGRLVWARSRLLSEVQGVIGVPLC